MPLLRLFPLPPTPRETAARGRANAAAQGTLFDLAADTPTAAACHVCAGTGCDCAALGREALTLPLPD